MSERTSSQPKLKEETARGKAARRDRLAAEMRKNLMKRKRQQREMTTDTDQQGKNETVLKGR